MKSDTPATPWIGRSYIVLTRNEWEMSFNKANMTEYNLAQFTKRQTLGCEGR